MTLLIYLQDLFYYIHLEENMGKNDRRNSWKMRRKKSHAKHHKRMTRKKAEKANINK